MQVLILSREPIVQSCWGYSALMSMRAPTLAEQGMFCITRQIYSMSIVVLVCFGFGYYFLIINSIYVYILSFHLWDLLFSSRSTCFWRADVWYPICHVCKVATGLYPRGVVLELANAEPEVQIFLSSSFFRCCPNCN